MERDHTRVGSEHHFDVETATKRIGDTTFSIQLAEQWNIGANPNGGYLMAAMLDACGTLGHGPDPLTITSHFMRPGVAGVEAIIDVETLKAGRTISTVRGSLQQEGKARLESLVGFGDLAAFGQTDQNESVPMPNLPSPDACLNRADLAQGVDLPLLERVDVRIPAAFAEHHGDKLPQMSGWIRFADGRAPDTRSLVLFADAFPPSVFTRYGNIGWVPTLEMTVHVRRAPVAGWIAAAFECDDLHNGTMIETGSLWDEQGNLVARSRQLGMLLPRQP